MLPALRQPLALTVALALLSACGETSGRDGAASPLARDQHLSQPRLSSQSSEILILEADGSVTPMALDSPAGRDAFEVSEAELALLNSNMNLDLSGVAKPAPRRGPTAQERAIAAFAARTGPALPAWREGTEVEDADFIAARVDILNPNGSADLVEVTANLRRGVDADIGFSYATCALAGWAKAHGGKYGRHIRTLQATRNDKLLIGAAFIVSDSKPLGLQVMETDKTLQECESRGIPAA